MLNKLLCFMWGCVLDPHILMRPEGESFGGWFIVRKFRSREINKCKHCGERK